jgi:hypothetical protein
MKKFMKNRKGTAEVIGTIMLIVILLFFFTNVYLWHDAATKDGNQLYMKQIHANFKIEQDGGSINITADGGSNIVLSRLWIVDPATGHHLYANLGNTNVPAGTFFMINFASNTNLSGNQIDADPSQGNTILIHYAPSQNVNVNCAVINTLGIVESTTITLS